MTGQEATCSQCDAAVRRADRFCESCGASLSEVRRIAIPRPGQSAAGPCADCGNDADFDEYCTVCGHRRAEPDRDKADLGGIVLITDRGIEHARNEDAAAAGVLVGSNSQRPDAIAVAVCDGVSSSDGAHMAAVAASTAGVDAMLAALVASRKAHAAVLAGLRAAANAAAAAADRSGLGAVLHVHRGDCHPDFRRENADHGRQRRRQQGVLASRSARSAATADGRRLAGAGTDNRGGCGRFGSRATRGAHPDSLARRRHRNGAVVGVECADDHCRRVRVGWCCAATDSGTTCPTRQTSHDSAAVPTRARPHAHSPNTHWMPVVRTTSPSLSSRSEGRHEFG